ncbi:MAG: class I SAM-dependent methyltransferase [bacterium]|nr:class I SAM-dependent methyltransferase [bacterium]
MRTNKPWHEDDALWRDLGPMLFSEGRWQKTPEEVGHVLALAAPEAGGAVLDLCCGPGRHSLEFARRGFRVTGVDRTRRYLAEARRRARAEGLAVEFVLDDARRFRRPGAFDLAVNLYTSFGFFEDPADQRRVLAGIHASLKPGGTLVMELMGKEILARVFRERTWDEVDGRILLEERHVTADWSIIENRWILLDGDRRRVFRFRHWIYSAAELTALVRASGFGGVEIRGSLAGAPYDHKAQRLVAVARKEAGKSRPTKGFSRKENAISCITFRNGIMTK